MSLIHAVSALSGDTGETPTATIPAGVQAGNVAYFWATTNSGVSTATTPPGWTLMSGPVRNGNTLSGWLFQKSLVEADAGTTVSVTISGGGKRGGGLVIVSSASADPGVMTEWNDNTLDTDLSIPAYTPLVADAQVLVINSSRFLTADTTVTYPGGYTEAFDATTTYGASPWFGASAAYKKLVGGPSAQPAENGVYSNPAQTIGWVLTHEPDDATPPSGPQFAVHDGSGLLVPATLLGIHDGAGGFTPATPL